MPQSRRQRRRALRSPEPKQVRGFKDLIGVPTLSTDPTKLTADFVISTSEIDREWEIMDPAGCDLGPYARGPAPVFYNHQQFPLPIGSSKANPSDPACPLSVKIESEGVRATCFFNQASPESETIFKLVELGHLGATSVGFLGLDYELLSQDESDKFGAPYQVRRWNRWELTEWSIVGVGANRGALSAALAAGSIGGKSIPETIRKAFAPYALPRKFFPVGSELPASTVQSQNPSEVKTMPTQEKANEAGALPGQVMMEKYIKSCHKAASEGIADVAGVEHPDIRKLGIKSFKDMIDHVQGVKEAASEHYPDMDVPKDELDLGDLANEIESDDEDKPDEKPAEDKPEEKDDDMEEDEAKALMDQLDKAEAELELESERIAALEKA
jgi:hypothetical protein